MRLRPVRGRHTVRYQLLNLSDCGLLRAAFISLIGGVGVRCDASVTQSTKTPRARGSRKRKWQKRFVREAGIARHETHTQVARHVPPRHFVRCLQHPAVQKSPSDKSQHLRAWWRHCARRVRRTLYRTPPFEISVRRRAPTRTTWVLGGTDQGHLVSHGRMRCR